MSDQLKVHYRVGDIEFEAEGSAEDVEKQRKAFMSELLPEAVNAVIKTHSTAKPSIINAIEPVLLSSQADAETEDRSQANEALNELARESLASYCNSFGNLSDQDFILVAAYFDEKKNGAPSFSRDSIHRYYQEARRRKHSNLSVPISNLISKGLIMDAPKVEGSTLLQYVLTMPGLMRIENKDFAISKAEKKPARKSPAKKSSARISSVYSSICLDDLDLKKYPEVKLLKSFKQRLLMIMYIITNESKGEFFSIADLQCLLTDIWGLPSTDTRISEVFSRNKPWFLVDAKQKDTIRRKLLEGGKDYARKIIDEFNATAKK